MSRADTESDIIAMLGQVPPFLASMPDETLEHEWNEWKATQLADTALTAKEKHLIGLGVAAAIHCPYCTYFHRGAAKMLGATDEEIEEAARFSSDTSKYSTYLFGLGTDLDEFKQMADEVGEHLQARMAEAKAA